MTTPVLGSYHYLRRHDLTALLAPYPGLDFFADSGAFSAATTGAVIDLRDYAAWLRRHAAVITVAAGLDVIGDPDATASNLDRLTDLVDGAVPLVPTFHVGTEWPVLEHLCATHPYVALGGAVAFNRRSSAIIRWARYAHRIAAHHGTRLHGFGLTRPPIPESAPWYSLDSSWWSRVTRSGRIALFDGRSMVPMKVGDRSVARHGALVRAYGGDPVIVGRPGYGMNRHPGDRDAAAARTWMDRAAAASLRAYAAHLAATRPPVDPPADGRVPGPGPKLYLAASTPDQIATAATATAPERFPRARPTP